MQKYAFLNPKFVVNACDSTQEHGESNTHVITPNIEVYVDSNIKTISDENDVNVFFDYIKFTIPVRVVDEQGEYIYGSRQVLINNKVEEIKEVFNAPEEIVFMKDYGGSGYKNCVSLGDYVDIFFNGGKQTRNKNDEETIMVEIKGQGCRYVESNLKMDLLYLIKVFKIRFNASFTRIDLSADVFTEKYFTLEQLFSKIINRHCTCPSSQFDLRVKTLDSEAKYVGQTIYVGSQASDRILCIYDKKQEQIAKNDNVDIWLDVWVRLELRFKRSWAKRLALDLCADDIDLRTIWSGLMLDFLDIKETRRIKDIGNHSSRDIPTWKPWSDFLNHTEKIKLTNQGINESNFMTKSEWHKNNVSPFETQLFLFDPKNFENRIYENIGSYLDKFDDKRLAELNVERQKQGLPYLKMDRAVEMLQAVKDKYCIACS